MRTSGRSTRAPSTRTAHTPRAEVAVVVAVERRCLACAAGSTCLAWRGRAAPSPPAAQGEFPAPPRVMLSVRAGSKRCGVRRDHRTPPPPPPVPCLCFATGRGLPPGRGPRRGPAAVQEGEAKRGDMRGRMSHARMVRERARKMAGEAEETKRGACAARRHWATGLHPPFLTLTHLSPTAADSSRRGRGGARGMPPRGRGGAAGTRGGRGASGLACPPVAPFLPCVTTVAPRPSLARAEGGQDWSRDGHGASPLEARAAAAAGMQGFERQQRSRERRLEARYGGGMPAAAAAGPGQGGGGAGHVPGASSPLSRRVQTRAGAAAGAAGPPEPAGGGRGMLLPRIETGQHAPALPAAARASESPSSPQPPIAPAVVDEMEAKLKAAEERRRRHAAGANGEARHRHHHTHAAGGRHGHAAPREGHGGGGGGGGGVGAGRRTRAPNAPRAPAAAAAPPPPPVAAPPPRAPPKHLETVEDAEGAGETEEWPGASEDVFQRSQFYVAPIPQFGRR